MKLSIHGRKITLTDAIKKYAEEKISRVEKFNDSILKIDATLAASKLKTGNAHVTEILAYLSGSTLKATATETDLYASIDKAVDIMENQLKKHKEKRSRAKVQDDTRKKSYSFDYIVEPEEKISDEKKLVRVYLPLKPMEISEAILQLEYLNRVFLGQHSYGVQSASQGYFSKDVKDLTIAESALLAAIVQSPSNYSLYKTIKPENVNDESSVIKDLNINGQVYKAVYNPKVLDRQKYVLKKMYQLKKITKEEYEEALKEDVFAAIKPNKGFEREVSTYFTEYVKYQVAEKLMKKYNYTKEEAWNKIYNGGLTIHSTMDQTIQKNIEKLYSDFANVMKAPKRGNPAFASFKRDRSNNITDAKGKTILYKKSNILDEDNNIIIFLIFDIGSFDINSPVYIYFVNLIIINDKMRNFK